MKYAKQNEIYLKEEIELLDKYVELEQMRFENKIDYIRNHHITLETTKLLTYFYD